MLALNHVMRNGCILAGDEFGSGIAECDSLADRNVILDNRGLRFILDDDQISRMRHQRFIAGSRNKEKINGIGQHDAPAHVHVSTIFRECSVQSRKSVATNIEIAAKMRFYRTRVGADFFRQAVHAYACR